MVLPEKAREVHTLSLIRAKRFDFHYQEPPGLAEKPIPWATGR